MGTMTALPRGRGFTRRDLGAMPDDGHRYELIDGSLVVTPAPSPRHQLVVAALLVRLTAAATPGLRVLTGPLDVALSDDTVLQPDVLVCRDEDLTSRDLPGAPLLAIEVLSPSTRHVDLDLKKSLYEAAGCPSYWVVDPDAPGLTVWELREGGYVEVVSTRADERCSLDIPFPIDLRPSDLVR